MRRGPGRSWAPRLGGVPPQGGQVGRLHAPLHWLTRSPRWPQCAHLSVCLARVLPSSPVTCDCCVSWTNGEATDLPSLLVHSLLPPLPATLAQALSPLPTCPVPTEPPEPASGLGLGVGGTLGPAGTSFSPAWASGPGLTLLITQPTLGPGAPLVAGTQPSEPGQRALWGPPASGEERRRKVEASRPSLGGRAG